MINPFQDDIVEHTQEARSEARVSLGYPGSSYEAASF